MGFSKVKIILFALLLVSCGSKKKTVQRSGVKAVDVVNKDVVNKVENDITSNVTLTHKGSKITIKPMDANQKSTYNGIEFQNAVIEQTKENKVETKKETDNTVEVITDNSSKRSEVDKSETNKDIDIDRSWGLFDWLWLFMAILIVIIGVRLYIKKINPLKGLKNIIGI